MTKRNKVSELSGLQRLCRAYGRMKIQGIMFSWDYVNECAVRESEMPVGSERWKASERARWAIVKPPEKGKE